MFQEDFGGLRAKDFHHPLIAPTDDIVIFAEWGFYFRAIFHPLEILVDYIPDSILRLLFPPALGIKTLINVSCRGPSQVNYYQRLIPLALHGDHPKAQADSSYRPQDESNGVRRLTQSYFKQEPSHY